MSTAQKSWTPFLCKINLEALLKFLTDQLLVLTMYLHGLDLSSMIISHYVFFFLFQTKVVGF